MDASNVANGQGFEWMYPRIQAFLNDTICNDDIDDELYVEGSTRIEFYATHGHREPTFDIEEHKQPTARPHDFEEALFERLLQPRTFNLLVLLGGLGAGKTTTIQYILRRFHERREHITSSFRCVCKQCFRRPIYLDFRALGQERALRRELILTDVFRQLRLQTYRRLLTEWLQRNGNDIARIKAADTTFVVLRRLLIANDLLRFHGGDHPALSQLHEPTLMLDGPLTTKSLSDQEVIDLITHYERPAATYDAIVQKVSHDPDHSQDFMVLTLQYYLYGCNLLNPNNLIVLDNLDQLPTQHIEELLTVLHDLATHTSGLPLLVPLRPSSINPYGFVREILFRYHYGPNSFQMILNRLERFVLNKSRDELKLLRSNTSQGVFSTPPAEQELDALLVITYLYARIMANGAQRSRQGAPQIKLHGDHAFLKSIRIGRGTLLGLAETSDALVGACCRYGLDLMRRFFENAYSHPQILQRAMSLRATYRANQHIRLSYADLVTNLLRDPIGGSKTTRVANLFRPTESTSNPGWPTLTKLRILSLLSREKRQEVRAIVQHLGLLGIPADLTIDALNSLQDKFRLLIWFSTNRDISLEDDLSLSQDVVISEHGERYFRRVVGDFEYVWFCATALNRRKYLHEGMRFTVKLNDYKMLIEQIGITEWKQIGFRRLRAANLSEVKGAGQATQMEVLNVLYSSLARAVLAAGILMKTHWSVRRLKEELLPLFNAICDQILLWQQKYEMAYGSNFYLSIYKDQISELKHEMLRLFHQDLPGGDGIIESLRKVHHSWLKEEKSAPIVNFAKLGELPKTSLVTLLNNYGKGFLPDFGDGLLRLRESEPPGMFIARFIQTRWQLTKLLESRFPTYSELIRYLSYLLGDIQVTSSHLYSSRIGDLRKPMMDWLNSERHVLQEVNDDLTKNKYDVPEFCKLEQMSELKRRYNNISDATERLARHLGVFDTEHLSYRWQ
jgi:hypothetical protein